MASEPIIVPEADQDIADAYQWLERRDPGLGKDFLRSLAAPLETIAPSPEAFSCSIEGCRHFSLRRFPYVVLYDFVDPDVIVYAVFHSAQDPDGLRRKLWLRKPL